MHHQHLVAKGRTLNTTTINLKDLTILSQTSEQIIATGKDDDVNLYFDGRYDLIRKDYNSPVEDVFPFVVIRKETTILRDEKVNNEIELESHLLPQANDKDVVVYSPHFSNGQLVQSPVSSSLLVDGML